MPYERGPWVGEIEIGTHAFCACGASRNKPFCDGSHATESTGKTPNVCEIAVMKRTAICQCGTSANQPFCDGSHKRLP